MNKIIFPSVLFIIALGIFLTYTKGQYAKVQALKSVNAVYQKAIDDSVELIRKRDQVVNAYNSISEADRTRLEQILPDRVDIIRLVIDIRSVIERRGGKFKDVNIGTEQIKVGTGEVAKKNTGAEEVLADGTVPVEDDKGIKPTAVTLKFTATYEDFLDILRDIESSLRLIEVSSISFEPGDSAQYEYTVKLKTFWLKQ
ncbi:MAG: hypothetical protein KBD47_02905 [Candidatus Pacebacteria bacterium]|jgi:hypothetical protein|nr:hypothetical protein [Candidatus Paceibacterota bacterium]